MWSRRAQEYEAKINSGDLVAIAEVVRDLYRSEAQPEQSYSERQLYEAALDRVAREIAVVQKLTETESLKLIESQLQKGPRRTARPKKPKPIPKSRRARTASRRRLRIAANPEETAFRRVARLLAGGAWCIGRRIERDGRRRIIPLP